MKAFPHTKMERGANGSTWDMAEVRYEGMDLRDYFAAKAMAAYIATRDRSWNDYKIAGWAYESADAMMEARKNQPTG